ncbi:hypothetical protein ABS71_02420 [bacterium SCN 62-11]|nr:HD domain-containing protein [Candidatus Eremiobacteraeota bacterium]ODT77747.1 MAG: hypothetical protein ABS71_02420 [bacterium SCN 62-11]
MFVAQTNLQLYAQLPPSQLPAVAAAYELATQLFSGQFRASGKPFLAHLVGTASILAQLGRSLEEITTGLLHAAYDNGDFGANSGSKREEVRGVIGELAESYLETYSSLPWDPDRYPASDSPLERAALVVRVANELEDLLDGSLAWVGPQRAAKMQARIEPTARLADRLELPELARALRQIQPCQPASSNRPESSYTLAPRTYARVAEIVAKRLQR